MQFHNDIIFYKKSVISVTKLACAATAVWRMLSCGLVRVFMNETHLSVFHSVLNALMESAGETVSLPGLTMLSTRCFSLAQETLPHSDYMIWPIFT